MNDWRAPSLDPPKDRDFATSIGPWIETDYDPEFDFAAAREVAARNTRLRAGDLLVAPPFAVGVGEATVPGLGTLVRSARQQRDEGREDRGGRRNRRRAREPEVAQRRESAIDVCAPKYVLPACVAVEIWSITFHVA